MLIQLTRTIYFNYLCRFERQTANSPRMTMKQDCNKVQNSILEDAQKIFEHYIKAHSLRKTPERFAVLEAVCATEEVFTNEQIYNKLITDMKFHISRSTIYNTLDIIEKAHLIKRHQGNWKGDARLIHYEKCLFHNAHHGFICKECGSTLDFNTKATEKILKNLEKAGMKPETYTFFVYGICPSCMERLKKLKKEK